jgi:D-tyrosyl-tRNA(Tyr) deacylase
MRVLLQRVKKASVTIENNEVRSIETGLVAFLGVREGDDDSAARYLADRTVNLRLFEDQEGKTNLSLRDVGGSILAISQFTLYADCTRGRRPGFTNAGRPEIALPLYQGFVKYLKEQQVRVAEGEFGAHMLVEIHNDGPFTIWLDSDDKKRED